jgi:hypothetical protein
MTTNKISRVETARLRRQTARVDPGRKELAAIGARRQLNASRAASKERGSSAHDHPRFPYLGESHD